ncbi:hypothetical protein Tco_0882813 [Tanacetum coccineum]
MYYKKNMTFVALIWEDLAYQIENIDSKKQEKMFYPRFTKIIILNFLKMIVQSPMRNMQVMHTARDDSLLGTMRFISRHADTQPNPTKCLVKVKKKSDSTISSEESPSKKKYAKAKKVIAAKPKPTKKKASVKADREEKDDDENDSEDENDDDGNDDDDDDGNDGDGDDDDDANNDDNQEDNDTNDDDEETDSDRTNLVIIKIHVLNQSNTEYYEEEEEKINDEETMDEE